MHSVHNNLLQKRWIACIRRPGFTHTPKLFGVTLRSKRGFTLIEMLTSIGIFVLLTLIFAVNMRAFEGDSKLNTAAEELAAQLIAARNHAWSGLTTECGAGLVVPEGGYGIAVATVGAGGSYAVFADCDGNFLHDGPNELLETINLPDGIALTAVEDADGSSIPGNPASGAHVTFRPPTNDAFVYNMQIPPTSNDAKRIVIILEHIGSGKTKTITLLRLTKQILID